MERRLREVHLWWDGVQRMTRSRCAGGCAVAVALMCALVVWLNFAWAYERERAASADGEWIATAYIDGAPLTAENERVHIWRWWQPHFRWLGCQVLEAKNESPTRLIWEGLRLRVQHGFRAQEVVTVRDRCGPVSVSIERKFRPYS
jgi:hypothetical protein